MCCFSTVQFFFISANLETLDLKYHPTSSLKMTSCLKLKILTTVAILLKYFYTSELVLKNSEIFFSIQMSTHAFHWKSSKKSRNLKSIQKLKNLKHFTFSIVCASTTRFTTFNFVLVNNTHFVLFTFSSSSLSSDTGCWWVVILLTTRRKILF